MAYLFFKRRAIRLNVFLLGMNNCLHQDHSRCDRRDWNAERQSQREREREGDTGKGVRAGEMGERERESAEGSWRERKRRGRVGEPERGKKRGGGEGSHCTQ